MVKPYNLEESEPLIVSFVGVVIELDLRIQYPLFLTLLVRLEQALWLPFLLAVGRRRLLNLVRNTVVVKHLLSGLEWCVAVERLLT